MSIETGSLVIILSCFFFVESPYKIATTESSQVFIQVYTILYKFESMKLYPRFKF